MIVTMNILILGANGFIGSTILTRLLSDGHQVTGLGRNLSQARQKWPAANWVTGHLATMTTAQAWRDLVMRHDVVVNCAGALQDGLSDDLTMTQEKAMVALYTAASLAGNRRIVQISARTDIGQGTLPFLTTKRRADEALAASSLPYVILRPTLVIGRNAHGGTALIRALASIPFALPLIHADSPVQTVAVEDVAEAVARSVTGDIPSGTDIELATPERLTLKRLVQLHRQWLGLPPVSAMPLPAPFAKPVTWLADIAGRLGWRSPLRSTAMKVMSQGVTSSENDPSSTHGLMFRTTQETLSALPSGVQDLWFARLYLLKPVTIVCLSLFWLLSGLVPLFQPSIAASHFLPFMSYALAITITLVTCLIDIALGLLVLVRPFARKAMIGMLAVTASYLAGGTLLEPGLWLDPLGPLVKVMPSIALTLIALATLDER